MYTTNTLLDEKSFSLSQKYSIYHQPFTNTYQSNRYIYIIDKYFCKFIHNPIISSIILILSYTYYYYYYYYYNNDNYDYDDYYLPQYLFVNDLVSNIINLICILRFQYRFKFNHLIGELIFFIGQSILSYQLIINQLLIHFNESTATTTTTTTTGTGTGTSTINCTLIIQWTIVLQMILPIIILVFTYVDNYRNRNRNNDSNDNYTSGGLYSVIFEGNNHYIPVFLSYSFFLININLINANTTNTTTTTTTSSSSFSSTGSINTISNWFLELTFQQLIKFIYQLSCFSFKFYLMYQFILYELSINQIGFKKFINYQEFYPKLKEEDEEEEEDKNAITTTTTRRLNIINFLKSDQFKNMLMILVCLIIIIIDIIQIK
ncbi:hypothetical protein MGM_05036 [Candida albicans P75063]|nr:hypothetical protein MGM_05036 [Candida albicans P75063]